MSNHLAKPSIAVALVAAITLSGTSIATADDHLADPVAKEAVTQEINHTETFAVAMTDGAQADVVNDEMAQPQALPAVAAAGFVGGAASYAGKKAAEWGWNKVTGRW